MNIIVNGIFIEDAVSACIWDDCKNNCDCKGGNCDEKGSK